jgi:hypothetical protein
MAILLIVVLTSTTQLPVWWAMYQTEIVVGWPMMIICIYIVRMGYYRLRVWRAQLRIERLVLANIDRAIEHQIYDQSPERPTRLITSPTYQATSSWPSFGPSKRIGLIPAYLQVLDRELIAPGLEGTTQPTSLLATLQGAVADFERFSANPHPIGRTIPCMVYRSIGDVLVRELFEKQLHREHDHMGDYWKVLLASDLAKHLTSAASLTQIIKQTLRTGITRDSVKILRTNSALHLLKLLQLPENEHMGLVGAVDELQCCAKPLLNVTPYIHLSESTREMAVYLSVDESIVATLRATVQNREAHRFISSSCDPFGMHCIIVLNGLTLQSLPFG